MRKFGIETESILGARERVLVTRRQLSAEIDEIESAVYSSGGKPIDSKDWREAVVKQGNLSDQVVFRYTNYYEGEEIRPLARRRTIVFLGRRIPLPEALAKKERQRVILRRPDQH